MKREFAIYICLVYCSILSKPIFGFDDVSSEFCKLENDANKAYIAHDRQFLSNLFADEFVHVNYRGGTVDKQGEIDFFASPKLTMKAAAVDHCTAHKYGNVALVTGINLDRNHFQRKRLEWGIPLYEGLCAQAMAMADRGISIQQTNFLTAVPAGETSLWPLTHA